MSVKQMLAKRKQQLEESQRQAQDSAQGNRIALSINRRGRKDLHKQLHQAQPHDLQTDAQIL